MKEALYVDQEYQFITSALCQTCDHNCIFPPHRASNNSFIYTSLNPSTWIYISIGKVYSMTNTLPSVQSSSPRVKVVLEQSIASCWFETSYPRIGPRPKPIHWTRPPQMLTQAMVHVTLLNLQWNPYHTTLLLLMDLATCASKCNEEINHCTNSCHKCIGNKIVKSQGRRERICDANWNHIDVFLWKIYHHLFYGLMGNLETLSYDT